MKSLSKKSKRLTTRKPSSARKVLAIRRKRRNSSRRNPDGEPKFNIELSSIHGARIVRLHDGFLYAYDPATGRFNRQFFTPEQMIAYRGDIGTRIFNL